MVGGSSIFSSSKPAKGTTTEKKKRKRPSKKVPTTVVDASSNNFMNLVQKLTGSAEELAVAADAGKRATKSTSDAPDSSNPSPYPSPYSSPSNHTSQHDDVPQPLQHYHQSSDSYYQPYLRSSSSMGFHDQVDDRTPYSSAPTYMHQDAAMASLDHYHGSSTSTYGYTNYTDYVGSASRDDESNDLYHYSGRSSDATDAYPSTSRATDTSPMSWRDSMNHNSTSDYWYQADPMTSMRA